MSDERQRPDSSPLGDRREQGAGPPPEGVLQSAHARRRTPSTRRPGRGQRPRGSSGGRKFLRVVVWLVVLAVLGGGGYFGWQRLQAPPEEEIFSLDPDQLRLPETSAGDRAVVLVFPEWDASGYVTEERQIPSRDRAGEDLLGLMQVLCEGPRISGAVSAFPAGTEALSAFYNPADRSVVLDFSQELVTGHPGGSTAEAATLTSILRTVALNFPDTRSCLILVDGAQVQTLAGHLTMDRPFDPRRWL